MQGHTTYLNPGFLVTLYEERHSIHFTQIPGQLRRAAPARLAVVDALSRGYTGDIEAYMRELSERFDIPFPGLMHFIRNLRSMGHVSDTAPTYKFSVMTEEASGEIPAGRVVVHGPVSLITQGGQYLWHDHAGRLLMTLNLAEVHALSAFMEGGTVEETRAAYRAQDPDPSLDDAGFDALVRRLDAAQLFVEPPPESESGKNVPMFRRVDATQVQSLVDARVAAHDEEMVSKGLDLMQVVPVNTEKGMAPASLGLLVAYAMEYEGGHLRDKYNFVPMFLTDESRLVARGSTPGVYMFSNYVWNVEKNLALSAAVKAINPNNITVHGGPSTPSYEQDCAQFFVDNPHVDIAVRGEGEQTFTDILIALDGRSHPTLDVMQGVDGLSYRTATGVARTGNRERIADLNTIPSPYLMGLFEEFGSVSAGAVIESNRGCPYGCTFCDWGSATLSKVRRFDLDRVYKELEWSATHQIEGASIADANFGMLERDVDITEKIAELKRTYGFPRSVAINYAKNQVRYLRQIIEIMADVDILAEGVVSLQTTDESTLKVIDRSNIKLDKYDELSTEFRRARLPLAADIMMGLPGSTKASFKDDLQKCTNRDIRVRANPTQLLPNSPMNEPNYRKEHGIVARPGEWVQETATYTRAEWDEMEDLRIGYYMFESFGVLRYVARFVRRETGVGEVEFYDRLRAHTLQDPQQWPLITTAFRYMQGYMAPPGSWGLFVEEVRRYLLTVVGLPDSSGLSTALKVQHAHLPAPDRAFPLELNLEHDFLSWQTLLLSAREEGHRDDWEKHVPRLSDLGPAKLVIHDPDDICQRDIGKHRFVLDLNFRTWELESPIARPRLGVVSNAV